MTKDRVRLLMARAIFAEAFAFGADPGHARKRHTVDPATHEHWRAGFDAGRKAAKAALEAYNPTFKETLL